MSDLQRLHESVWIAPSAHLSGRIAIAEGASIWHNAVMRAECQEIRIGRMTNVQDFVMIHVGYDHPTRIGDFCSITHHATVHGATLEDDCLVGIGAVLMDGVVIGRGSIVAGVPAKVIRERDSTVANRMNAWNYHRNAEAYQRGEHRAWDGAGFRTWVWAKLRELNDTVG